MLMLTLTWAVAGTVAVSSSSDATIPIRMMHSVSKWDPNQSVGIQAPLLSPSMKKRPYGSEHIRGAAAGLEHVRCQTGGLGGDWLL
jgi:hypothetical protein